MKLSKLALIAVLISFVIIVCVIYLPGCSDNQEIVPLPQTEPSLSSEPYSAEYTVEQAIEIFKSGDKEAINKVIMSKKSVIWDGKKPFKNGVKYTIPKHLTEKAREINEDFRRANDMDRAWQAEKDGPQWGCSNSRINDRNFRETTLKVNNLEFRITQNKNREPSFEESQLLEIDVYNPTDSKIDFDISKFAAVDTAGNQLNCRFALASSKNCLVWDKIKIYLSEKAGSLDINFVKSIWPGERLEVGIFFYKAEKFKTDKPFILYFGSIKIAEIYIIHGLGRLAIRGRLF